MSALAWMACLLAAVAAGLAFPGSPSGLARRRLGRGASSRAWLGTAGSRVRLVAAQVWHARARNRAREQGRRRAGVVELCDTMASELRGGRTPAQALEVAAASHPELGSIMAPAVAASHLGQDIPAALRLAQDQAGVEGLTLIAAAWEAAEDSGAALAEIMDRVGAGLRAEEDQRLEVRAQLAAPRATGRLLAVLPAFGILLGAGAGMNPLGVLFGTPYGLSCLFLGGGLAGLGLAWVERLVRHAEALR